MKVFAVASSVLKESFYRKSFFISLGLVLLCMVVVNFFIYISPKSEKAFLVDFTFQAIRFIASIYLIFMVSDVFYKEKQNHTLYFYFVNPVQDAAIVCGKYLGIAFVLAMLIFSTSITLFGFMAITLHEFNFEVFSIFLVLWARVSFLAACGILGGTIYSRATNALFVISMDMLCHFSGTIHHMIEDHVQIVWVKTALDACFRFVPDFQEFNPLELFVVDFSIPIMDVFKTVGLIFAYGSGLLIISVFFFKRTMRWNE